MKQTRRVREGLSGRLLSRGAANRRLADEELEAAVENGLGWAYPSDNVNDVAA